MSIIQKLKNATIPSIFSAGASLGIYYIAVDSNLSGDVPFAGTTLPTWAAVGGASFLGAEVGQILTDLVGNKIPLLDRFEGIEKAIIPPIMSGLSTFGVMKGLISSETDFKTALIVGAGGDLIGKYAYAAMYGNV